MLVATDAAIEKKAAADRALAQEPAVAGTVVFGEQSRFVLEIGDDTLNVFNILQIVNTAKAPVTTAAPLVFELPDEARRRGDDGRLDAQRRGGRQAGHGHRAVCARATRSSSSRIRCRSAARTIDLAQKLPAQMTQLAVVVQKVGAMQLSSPQIAEQREMSADGQNYIVGQGGAVRAGDTVDVDPQRAAAPRPRWPRTVALVLAGVDPRGRRLGRHARRRSHARRSRRGGAAADAGATSCSRSWRPSTPQRRKGTDRGRRLRRAPRAARDRARGPLRGAGARGRESARST